MANSCKEGEVASHKFKEKRRQAEANTTGFFSLQLGCVILCTVYSHTSVIRREGHIHSAFWKNITKFLTRWKFQCCFAFHALCLLCWLFLPMSVNQDLITWCVPPRDGIVRLDVSRLHSFDKFYVIWRITRKVTSIKLKSIFDFFLLWWNNVWLEKWKIFLVFLLKSERLYFLVRKHLVMRKN